MTRYPKTWRKRAIKKYPLLVAWYEDNKDYIKMNKTPRSRKYDKRGVDVHSYEIKPYVDTLFNFFGSHAKAAKFVGMSRTQFLKIMHGANTSKRTLDKILDAVDKLSLKKNSKRTHSFYSNNLVSHEKTKPLISRLITRCGTQQKAANFAGVSQATLCKARNGSDMKPETYDKIVKAVKKLGL